MNKKGFTLMELLVVVILVAILAGIAMPQYFNAVERQRSVEAVGILTSIEKSQMRYAAINEQYASDFSDLDVDLKSSTSGDNVTGAQFTTDYFTYTLTNANVTALRSSGNYSIILTYSPANSDTGYRTICCEPSNDTPDICDIINIKTEAEGCKNSSTFSN